MKEDKPLAKGDARSASDVMRDTIGQHPLGTSAGAVGGLAAGAAIGTAAGPLGSLVGAAVGAAAGAMAGGGVADMIDPVAEDRYWRDNHATRPYASPTYTYDDYGPAYRYGVDAWRRNDGRKSFDELESDMAAGWDSARGGSRLAWDDARHASRDAWHRVKDTVERATPGDADRDGK